ncbi:MAG TPA: hypothetical protein VL614_27170 [Acetobacteraceae bacterium]|nr:hypothetical protein [Acetobacteraceae bacterium]
MSLYAAIDLHSSNSVLAVMDGDGTPVLRCRAPEPDAPACLLDPSSFFPARREMIPTDAAVRFVLPCQRAEPDATHP